MQRSVNQRRPVGGMLYSSAPPVERHGGMLYGSAPATERHSGMLYGTWEP